MSKLAHGLIQNLEIFSGENGQPMTRVIPPIWWSPSGDEVTFEVTYLPNGFQIRGGDSEITVLWSAVSMTRTDVIVIVTGAWSKMAVIAKASLPPFCVDGWVENQVNDHLDKLADKPEL